MCDVMMIDREAVIDIYYNVVSVGTYQVYAGGQQPNQKITVGSNILQSSFTVA
jgi:hypothetical protein